MISVENKTKQKNYILYLCVFPYKTHNGVELWNSLAEKQGKAAGIKPIFFPTFVTIFQAVFKLQITPCCVYVFSFFSTSFPVYEVFLKDQLIFWLDEPVVVLYARWKLLEQPAQYVPARYN